MVLKAGERKVYTTPSSLASRMGVVRGQTGDGFQVASEALGNTINVFALRQAKIEEEKWKADFSIKGLDTILKYSFDNSLNLSGFTNAADGYIVQSVESAPKRFKGWAKQYLGLMASREANVIANAVIQKTQVEAINKLAEREQRMIEGFKEDIWKQSPTQGATGQSNPFSFTQWLEDVMFPSLADYSVSWENLKSTLDASMVDSGHMAGTVEELKYNISNIVDRARLIRDQKTLIDIAAESAKEGKGLGYDSEYDEYDVISMMDQAMTSNENGIRMYEEGVSRGDIDSGMFTDIRPEDRKENAKLARAYNSEYGAENKSKELSASNKIKAQFKIIGDTLLNGQKNSILDVSNPSPVIEVDGISESTYEDRIPPGMEISDEQHEQFIKADKLAREVHQIGSSILKGKEVYKEGKEYKVALGEIQRAINFIGFEHPYHTAESLLKRFLFQEATRANTPDSQPIYLEDAEFQLEPMDQPDILDEKLRQMGAGQTGVAGYKMNPSIEAAKMLAWEHGFITDGFNDWLSSAQWLTAKDPEDINKIAARAEAYAYIYDGAYGQTSTASKEINTNLHEALLNFHRARTEGKLLNLELNAQVFADRLNPEDSDLEKRIEAVDELWNQYDTKGKKYTVDRSSPDWIKSQLKNFINANADIKKKIHAKWLGVFEFRYRVPGWLPSTQQSKWNEENFDEFIQAVLDSGVEEDLKIMVARSAKSLAQLKTSNIHEVNRVSGFANEGAHVKGTEFDFLVWKQFMNLINKLDDYGY
jgi:hypothetical protein